MLKIENVGVVYGGVVALKGVTMDVRPSQLVGLIGPNGAGKTTLFDVISGIQTPTSGKVHLAGIDVSRKSATWRARNGLRRTFQRQQPFGWLSVEDNILIALEGQGGSVVGDVIAYPPSKSKERARRQRVQEVIQQCGLTKAKDEYAGRLPVGLLRMVELARAVVGQPRLLLLDEPTSGLDDRESETLTTVIQHCRTEDRCGIILVEHDVPFVMNQSDHVIVLNLGEILAQGPPDQIRTNPKVRAAYLG